MSVNALVTPAAPPAAGRSGSGRDRSAGPGGGLRGLGLGDKEQGGQGAGHVGQAHVGGPGGGRRTARPGPRRGGHPMLTRSAGNFSRRPRCGGAAADRRHQAWAVPVTSCVRCYRQRRPVRGR